MKGGIAIMLGLLALAAAVAFHGLPEPTYVDRSNHFQVVEAMGGTGAWRIDQRTGETCLFMLTSKPADVIKVGCAGR